MHCNSPLSTINNFFSILTENGPFSLVLVFKCNINLNDLFCTPNYVFYDINRNWLIRHYKCRLMQYELKKSISTTNAIFFAIYRKIC